MEISPKFQEYVEKYEVASSEHDEEEQPGSQGDPGRKNSRFEDGTVIFNDKDLEEVTKNKNK